MFEIPEPEKNNRIKQDEQIKTILNEMNYIQINIMNILQAFLMKSFFL